MSRKIIILLIFIIFIFAKSKTKNYESIIIRYNKYKVKNISDKNLEDNLILHILYAKSIKEGKVNIISYNKKFLNQKFLLLCLFLIKKNI